MIKNLRSIVLTLLIVVIFFYQPTTVDAHILQTDHSIGAILHIDPEDDPVVGQPATFFFEFKDKTSKFLPANCTCIVSIIQQGKEIYTQSLFQNSSHATFSFLFPQKDVYQVTIKGIPISADSFQPFTLIYDLRVSREDKNQQTSFLSTISTVILITLLIIFSLIILFKKQR